MIPALKKSLFLCLLLSSKLVCAQSNEEKARNLMDKYSPTLVVLTINGTIITTTTGSPLPAKPQQRRTLGVTVADNGLIVVSNSAIDSSVGLTGKKAKLNNNIVTIKTAKTRFNDIEISYGDNTLLHGKVIRQNIASDVAFILPNASEASAKSKKFTKMDLSKFASAASEADRVVGLSRSSSAFGYMPTLVMGRVSGVYKGDRTYFVSSANNSQGMPIFTLDGNPLGVTVVKMVDGQPSGILATLSAVSIKVMADIANNQ